MKKLIILFAIFFSSCFGEREMSFERIDTVSNVGRCSNKEFLCYREYFIVYNYSGNEEYEEKMDRFVCNLVAKDSIDFKVHRFNFYQSSRKTNIPYIEKHFERWFNYAVSNDFIVSYEFIESEFTMKTYGMKPIIKIINRNDFSCD